MQEQADYRILALDPAIKACRLFIFSLDVVHNRWSEPAPVPAPAGPEPAPVPQPPPPGAPMKEEVTISLDVEFDTNKAMVKDKYYDEIKRVADLMKEFPDAKCGNWWSC